VRWIYSVLLVGALKRTQFFFEKKNQKTFTNGPRVPIDKSFLLLFFKKEPLSY
jgi:hypothetical protein